MDARSMGGTKFYDEPVPRETDHRIDDLTDAQSISTPHDVDSQRRQSTVGNTYITLNMVQIP